MSIRSKILAGCLALTLLTGLLGAFAQRAEQRLGRLAFDIYDNAFMTVSYLRAAQIEFAGFAARSGRSGPSADAAADLLGDLDVVVERAMSPRGRAAAVALRREVVAALPRLASEPAVASAVQATFERVVETFAGDGYRYRRDVGRLIATQMRQTGFVIIGSLLAALATTALINHSITPPVRRAVRVAQSIAGGNLDNPIATRGRGETADLLRALAVMQSSIARAMTRINALMDAQAASHADEIAVRSAQMEAALDNMNQGLCLFDAADRLVVANRRFAEMFGVPTLGSRAEAVLRSAGLAALLDVSGGVIEALSSELPDGRAIAVSQQVIASGGWVATYEDVSERRVAEARLAHMARHDLLTGLANRLLFSEHVQAAFARGHRDGSSAMLCLDLDRFKAVNDTLGHPAGDALLRAVAERMRACTREGDLVVRLGGDEFAVVQAAASQPTEATALARRLIEVLGEPFEIAGQRVEIGVSVGIALAGDIAVHTPEALIKCADLALYRAKAEGRGCYRFFEAEMDIRMQARRALELDLRGALANGQFELFYQPQVKVGSGISGFEALLRWHHPQQGLVSPAVFIPLAEEIGLIGSLGDWVLQRACAAAAGWPGNLKVAVNLSPAQFSRRALAEDVAAALAASGLPPHRLELEITETVLLQDDERVLETLHALRALGVRIAMDDFGTGYSSLGYLRRFPFDKIKIDQSFVRGVADRADCLAIVRAVIGLGRSLGMSVVAEGVETHEQLAKLIAEGCVEVQGYLFSRPRSEAAIEEMLQQHGYVGADEPEVAVAVAV